MSISRKNWSALSSLALQWTREDEEEVERERRRRIKSSSSSSDLELPPGATHAPNDSTQGSNAPSDSSAEQLQMMFLEDLSMRAERTRLRHLETVMRRKEQEEGVKEDEEGAGARVEILADKEEEGADRQVAPMHTTTKPLQAPSPGPLIPTRTTKSTIPTRQPENGESLGKDADPQPPSTPSRKFVSSVSISLDKSPCSSERSGPSTPMSPLSPTAPLSPRQHCSSPCQSPSPRGAQSPVYNGHTQEGSGVMSPSSDPLNLKQTPRPAFTRQSSRTLSFRMLKKKEEAKAPLQRSASVRIASKMFEFNTSDKEPNQDEDQASPFQRNSRQRVSSRSIQEKMERLAQAAQKQEVMRSPDVTQRTLFLLDEVTRKRGLFERDQPEDSSASSGITRQELRSFNSGMSDRINRLFNKTTQAGSFFNPTDLRHVDITSKKSLFENRGEDGNEKIPK